MLKLTAQEDPNDEILYQHADSGIFGFRILILANNLPVYNNAATNYEDSFLPKNFCFFDLF